MKRIKRDNTESVRTRFAPSPTGRLHIGNARTAVMNWLFTRRMEGRFILRIEDTDVERSTRESEDEILRDLEWLGLYWDEGPDLGGSLGPYRQSERMEIYRTSADWLLREGKAYPCYCSAEELEVRRRKQIQRGDSAVYDGRCRDLTREERGRLEARGEKPVLRFRADAGSVEFDDLIKGRLSFPGDQLGDFVILRTNGMPMYNFSCAVDDHRMRISHVIRGDDHVSNTPRQVLLFRAFGWDVPVFAHIPMILGPDRVRLSKRHGAVSVAQFHEQGYLPEALVNFLSLLSWSSESGEEILPMRRLIDEFDFSRVSSSAAVFDTEKLDWMNGMYIRQLEPGRLADLIEPFLKDAGYSVSGENRRVLAAVLQPKIERLNQIAERARPFFADRTEPEDDEAAFWLQTDTARRALKALDDLLETVSEPEWSGAAFLSLMKKVQETTGIRGKDLWMPVRVALTGQPHGPELPVLVEFLGLDKVRRFIRGSLT